MILLIAITCVLAYFVAKMQIKARTLPPSPFPFPFIGNLPQIIYGMIVHGGVVARLTNYKKFSNYGPVFTTWLGNRPIVHIVDLDISHDVMVKKGAAFAQRFTPFMIEHGRKGMGLIFSSGEHWSQQRRFSIHTLRNFGLGRNLIEDRIMLEINYRFDELDELIIKGHGEATIDPEHMLDLLIGNIINRMLFTERFTEEREKKFFELKAALDHIMNESSILDLMLTKHTAGLPILKQRMEYIMKPQEQLLQFFREQIEQKISDRFHELKDDGEDFVDAFLIQMKKNQKGGDVGSFTQESLELTLLDLWIAGQETTSTTMYWAFSYLLQTPRVLQKLEKEMIEVTGGSRPLTLADKLKTPYLNATILEILRLSSIVPLNMFRETSEDTVVGGYLVPKGTAIAAQLSVIMSDKETFGNPQEFDPDRFLGDDHLAQHVVAFGMGKRACLGESLARAEMYLILGNFLLRYGISPSSGTSFSMDAKSEMGTMRKARNYSMTITRR